MVVGLKARIGVFGYEVEGLSATRRSATSLAEISPMPHPRHHYSADLSHASPNMMRRNR